MENQGCACAPVNEEELYPRIDEVIKQHLGNKNALIMVLHSAQSLFGYLPRRVQEMVSEGLEIMACTSPGLWWRRLRIVGLPQNKGRHYLQD